MYWNIHDGVAAVHNWYEEASSFRIVSVFLRRLYYIVYTGLQTNKFFLLLLLDEFHHQERERQRPLFIRPTIYRMLQSNNFPVLLRTVFFFLQNN